MAGIRHAHEVMALLDGRQACLHESSDLGVRASWHRSAVEHGLEPDRVAEPDVLSQAELRVRRAPVEELSALSTPEIDRLFQRLVNHAQVVMLTDAQGVVVNYRCSSAVVDQCATLRVLPGSIWTEESQGTTGVGLCLRERRPVSVVMGEHFATKLAGLSCTVAPIFGAGGRLAATLNISSVRETDHALHSVLREMVASSARRIENHCFDRRHTADRVLRLSRHDDFCDSASEARIALDHAGRIIDATPLAQWLLAAGAIGRGMEALIGRRLSDVEGVDSLDRLLDDPAAAISSAQGPIHVRITQPARRSIGVVGGSDLDRPRSLDRRAGRTGALPSGNEADPKALTLREIVGDDPSLIEGLQIAERLYARGLPLLLRGESGSGKTQLARALHRAGPHAAGKFVAINCAAIPPDLIESELFGYRAGAFTGAARQGSPGRILGADGGTLFLDEIGDMPLALQARLLQVLSEGELVPVGATEPVRVRFALISATLRDLSTLVRERRFREDLFYRISGATLTLPAMRERTDRLQLIERAFERAAKQVGMAGCDLSPQARSALLAHDWPGNLRELQHVAQFAVTVSDSPLIEPGCLPPPLGRSDRGAGMRGRGQSPGVRVEIDRVALASVLDGNGWNVSAAAAILGVSRATLHRRLVAFELRRPDRAAGLRNPAGSPRS